MKTIVMLIVTVFSAGIAFGQNPHLVTVPTFTDNGTTMTVTGGIAGLGNNQLAIISITGTAQTSTSCSNAGGNVAPGQSRTETIMFSGKFMSDKNGRVNFSVSSAVPKSGLCPDGNWTAQVTDVVFSGLQ